MKNTLLLSLFILLPLFVVCQIGKGTLIRQLALTESPLPINIIQLIRNLNEVERTRFYS